MTIDSTLLHSVPLFASLPVDELQLLAERLRPCQFAHGDVVLREGEQCNEFFIVTGGSVDIIKALGTPDERLLAVRAAGTLVGELSLFSQDGRHTASVLAHGPLEMLAMTRTDFDGLLTRQPRLTYGLVQTLSLRLIESEQTTIRDLHAKNDALARALADLQAAQGQLVEKEKLERELEVARRIQSSLLPSQRPSGRGLDVGALMRPMSAVGGDFYDFIQFPDGRVGLAVGDVSDHGVPAALFMSMTVTLLRNAARRDAAGNPADPGDVLRSVNRGLLEFDMSGMFVTVLYGVLDPLQHEFAYARAGHEQPLLQLSAAAPLPGAPRSAEESGMWIVDRSAWGAASAAPPAPTGRRKKGTLPLGGTAGRKTKDEGRTSEVDLGTGSASTEAGSSSSSVLRHLPPASHGGSSSFTRGQALGIFPDPQMDAQRLPLPPRSVLLLYTDGAREAWDSAGELFGETRLRALLADATALPAQALCDRIFESLAAHRGHTPQQDDITLVAVRT